MASRSVNILINARDASGSAFKSAKGHLASLQAGIFSLKGALVGLGAGAAVKALTDGIRERMGEIDEIAKISDRLGIGTENLLALKKAAGLSGAEFELLNGSLEKMVKKVGEGSPVFEQLGLNVQALARMDAGDAFGQIADKINLIPGAAQRAAVAQEIFGRSGIKLINTLAVGSEGFANIRKEMDATGESFSRLDALKVEAANDAIDLLKQSVGKLKTEMAVGLASAIKVVTTDMDDFTKSTLTAGSSATAFKPLIDSMGIALDIVQLLDLGWKQWKKTMAEVLDLGAMGTSKLIEGMGKLSGYRPPFADFFKSFAEETALYHKEAAADAMNAWKEFGKASWSEEFNKRIRQADADARRTLRELQQKRRQDTEERLSSAAAAVRIVGVSPSPAVKQIAASVSAAPAPFVFKPNELSGFGQRDMVGNQQGFRSGLAAMESRFLTRAPGSGEDPAKATKKATEEAAKTLKNVEKILADTNDVLSKLGFGTPVLVGGART